MNRRDFFKTAAAPIVIASCGFKMSATDSSAIFEDNGYFEVGDIVHVPRTAENMIVEGFKNGKLIVKRGIGGSPVKPIVEDDAMWILGNARPDEIPPGDRSVTRNWICERLTQSQ